MFGDGEEMRAHLSDEDQNDEDTTEDRSPDSTHGAEGQFLDGVTCCKGAVSSAVLKMRRRSAP
jgi:hypothetical protein